MRNLFLVYVCCAGFLATLSSCDNESILGGSVLPEQDRIYAFYDTVRVLSRTVQVDSILYRSSLAYLGEFTDPFFGTSSCDFMAQLYCPFKYSFPDDVKRIDSSFLYLYYNNWFGDSSTLMHVSVYELSKQLNVSDSYYTNLNASLYCDKSRLLGQSSFTAGDLSTSDSLKSLNTYSTMVRIPIDLSLGNRFLRDYSTNPEYFETPENFRDYFNGIYVTSDFGNGSIVYITHSELELCYGTTLYSNTMEGLRDSFVLGASYFPVTKEVKQVSRFNHVDLKSYLNPDNASDSLNYVFSPAGLYTRVTIPSSVFNTLSGKSVNGMKLKVNATQLDGSNYGLAPPSAMMLIRESEALSFFSRFEMTDGLNSFLAEYDSRNKYYNFNLSYYAQKMVRELDDSTSTGFEPFTDMLMIPVTIVKSSDGEKVRLEQLLTPSAVKIRGWNHPTQPMKLELIYSKGKIN